MYALGDAGISCMGIVWNHDPVECVRTRFVPGSGLAGV